MRIFLIGYMGSGKSTVGKKLASKLELSFFDLDEYIEDKSGYTINDLFNTLGENEFRIKEKEALDKILLEDNFVLATGGGTPCYFDNMLKMNDKGITFYLQMEGGFLTHRLVNSKIKRPLLQNIPKDELSKFIIQQVKVREEYYLRAKYILKGNDLKLSDLVDRLQ